MLRQEIDTLDLSALFQIAIAANDSLAQEYDVKFICSGIYGPLFVDADPQRMMQIMQELLSNEANFSHSARHIEVSLEHYCGSLHVAVKDHGNGIAEISRDTLFDKFSQADSSDQLRHGGSGLGLSIVKKFVEEHNGKVHFTTEAGNGSTFYVDLPELEAPGN
ncbi:MAG: signal transduction histidine kinase [Arenicella sp.]